MTTHSRHARGLQNRPVDRTPEQDVTALTWLEPAPNPLAALRVQQRLAEVAAEHADGCAFACLRFSEIEARRWHRRAVQHRKEAAVIATRIALT